MFLRRQGRREPFFAAYCNGTTSTCDGMSQWGSQDLASRGYSPIEILRYYYPSDIQIVESNKFTSNVGSFGGVALKEGSSGEDVRTMQRYLNRIGGNFYLTPISPVDGVFGSGTKATTMEFQRLANLIPDGIIGKGTWYEITRYYVAVKELAELTSEGERISVGAAPPNVTIQINSRGPYVVELQFLLNYISLFFPTIPWVVENGVFRDDTKRSVVEFQKEHGLTPDGIVGPATWNKLYDVYHSIEGSVVVPPGGPDIPAFPGVPLRLGTRSDDVATMQRLLAEIAKVYTSVPSVEVDGIFGPATQAAVIAFQRLADLAQDGVIGQITWYEIVDFYNNLPTTPTPQFPGTALRVGSTGSPVRFMQQQLSDIRKVFPAIPDLAVDGIFGTGTQASVIAFQSLFGLTPDGVIGRYTWDKITQIHDNLPTVSVPVYPGTALRVGSRNSNVVLMQKYLNAIAGSYPSIPGLSADGIFGPATERSVIAFQNQFGLTPDGVIGINTWNKIVSVYNLINMNISGTTLYMAANTERPAQNTWAFLLALNALNRRRYFYY